MLKGKASPVFGSLFGSLPQCGFSVISTDLFTKGSLSIGALLAVYVATSDEALPIMLSHGDSWISLLALIGCKIVLGIIIGYLAIWLYPKFFKTKGSCKNYLDNADKKEHKNIKIDHNYAKDDIDLDKHNHEHDEHNRDAYEHEHHEHDHNDEIANKDKHNQDVKNLKFAQSKLTKSEHIGCCKHDLESKHFEWKHPLLHCIKILGFILIINILFGLIVESVGEDSLTKLLLQVAVCNHCWLC
jgi:hypothetical protein